MVAARLRFDQRMDGAMVVGAVLPAGQDVGRLRSRLPFLPVAERDELDRFLAAAAHGTGELYFVAGVVVVVVVVMGPINAAGRPGTRVEKGFYESEKILCFFF